MNVTVIQDYYAIASANRKLQAAQLGQQDAAAFLDITQKQEQGGEAAHSDVIKALLQLKQRDRDVQDAQLALDKAKVALAVLIFPTLQNNFTIVDDLADLPTLASLDQMTNQTKRNPELIAAEATVEQARQSINVSRYAYLPSFALDFFYGIDANQFTNRTSHPTDATGRSTLPDYLVSNRQNLGYSAQVTLNIPIWDWGTIHSKVKQAWLKEKQSRLDLETTQRQLDSALASSYAEAKTAFAEVASLQESNNLASESLRLTLLRYKAGEATTLEVVDAQNTAIQSRNAYADGLLRYRIAFAALQQLTGDF